MRVSEYFLYRGSPSKLPVTSKFVRHFFPRSRFRDIHQCWHFRDIGDDIPPSEAGNKLWKLQPVLELLARSFDRNFLGSVGTVDLGCHKQERGVSNLSGKHKPQRSNSLNCGQTQTNKIYRAQ